MTTVTAADAAATQKLPFPTSLVPGVALGPARGQYARAAVVAVLVSVPAVTGCLLTGGAVLAFFAPQQAAGEGALLLRAATAVWCPGLLLLLVSMCTGAFVGAPVALIAAGANPPGLDIFLAVLTLVSFIGVSLWSVRLVRDVVLFPALDITTADAQYQSLDAFLLSAGTPRIAASSFNECELAGMPWGGSPRSVGTRPLDALTPFASKESTCDSHDSGGAAAEALWKRADDRERTVVATAAKNGRCDGSPAPLNDSAPELEVCAVVGGVAPVGSRTGAMRYVKHVDATPVTLRVALPRWCHAPLRVLFYGRGWWQNATLTATPAQVDANVFPPAAKRVRLLFAAYRGGYAGGRFVACLGGCGCGLYMLRPVAAFHVGLFCGCCYRSHRERDIRRVPVAGVGHVRGAGGVHAVPAVV